MCLKYQNSKKKGNTIKIKSLSIKMMQRLLFLKDSSKHIFKISIGLVIKN